MLPAKKTIFQVSLSAYLYILALCIGVPSKHELFAESTGKKAIVFDLGGVLFKPKKFSMAYNEIGISTILQHMVFDRKSPTKLKARVFKMLAMLGTQASADPRIVARMDDGQPLPQVMHDWQSGKKHYAQILKEIYELMDRLDGEGFFVSKREKQLLRNTVTAMFSPEILSKYMEPERKAYALLKELQNCPDCQLYIISNWDPHSFGCMYRSEAGKKIFRYFEPAHIVVSGQCGFVKPQPAIFDYFLERYNLDPRSCIFIDDQLENVETARSCGLEAIWFNGVTFDDLRAVLVEKSFL
jgi:HAD superfamily hydrolase (TIGR01549 family)